MGDQLGAQALSPLLSGRESQNYSGVGSRAAILACPPIQKVRAPDNQDGECFGCGHSPVYRLLLQFATTNRLISFQILPSARGMLTARERSLGKIGSTHARSFLFIGAPSQNGFLVGIVCGV
jgi:hypothetical protein